MTYNEYRRQLTWLREVLLDAQERGDYNLEMDVKEQLHELETRYDQEDTQ
jgi:hypothetical protein